MKKFRLVLAVITVLSLIVGVLIFLFTGGTKHNVLPLISMGEKFLGEEEFEDAELAFSRAINIDPKTSRAYYGKARASLGLGNESDAIDLLNTVASLSPDKRDKIAWMISKIEAGEGEKLILLPFRADVSSDDEFGNLNITSDDREIVVTLDTSGSMSGTPLEATREATKRFAHEILRQYADMGIVTFNDSSSILSDFTMNEGTINEALDGLYSTGGTNTGSGLQKAYEMIGSSGARNKIIVLMSDGESGDDPLPMAQQIKDAGITIYTLGFFSEIYDKSYVQGVMEGIASDGCHYEVDSENDLQDFFTDIANQINGQKFYYIRIACPVDVSVRYHGEKLESKGAESNQRTSFGTLTFEENDDEDKGDDNSDNADDRIKVLRLKEGADYEIEITGNGKGRMNYTIGFMNDDGAYADVREFRAIPVTKKTEIMTEACNAKTTTLEVDSDGDGKIDTRYIAKANSRGEKVEYTTYIMFAIIAFALLVILIIVICIVRRIRKKKAVS